MVGAFAGAALVAGAYGASAIDLGLGQTTVADDVSIVQALIAEAVATFVLMTAIMGLAVDQRAPAGWAGLMIGLAVTVAILVAGPLTGGSLNPARTLGPLIMATIGGGDTQWNDLVVYLIGPLAGATVAAFAYDAIARPRDATGPAEPPQGTQGDIEGRRDGPREDSTATTTDTRSVQHHG